MRKNYFKLIKYSKNNEKLFSVALKIGLVMATVGYARTISTLLARKGSNQQVTTSND
jgi:hypothetical protein